MKHIGKYLQEQLSEQELEQTTGELLADKIRRERRARWAAQLATAKETTPKPVAKQRTLTWPLSIAASLLIGLGTLLWLMPSQPTTDKLISEHLATPLRSDAIRKGMIDLDKIRLEAVTAYVEQDFAKAAKLHQQLVDATTTKEAADYLYLGLSYLYQTPPVAKSAVSALEISQSLADKRYQEVVDWFLSLAYWQAGEKDKANTLWQQIEENKQWNAQKAAELREVSANE